MSLRLEIAGRDGPRHPADAAVREFRNALGRRDAPLIGFATGGTFTRFYERLAAGGLASFGPDAAHFTHLDEYLGFEPLQRGSMVDEMVAACPLFRDLLAAGRLVPVPGSGDPADLEAHEHRLASLGGVDLQFLGIGRNGHIAFNEPGTDPSLGFHVTELAEATRADAVQRFAPDPVPQRAVTSGIASILGARRLVLLASGKAKADAVARMLEGPIDRACPASFVRKHADVLVVVDEDAAGRLSGQSLEDIRGD